jgi:hypothetical protein
MTTAIAIFGAFLATLGFVWQVWTWNKDRYRLTLSAGTQQIYPGGVEAPATDEVVFRIINTGRQPATIVSFGWECDRAKAPEGLDPISYEARNGTDSKGSPIVLQQGEWHEYRLHHAALDVGQLRAWAKDVNGKVFTSDWHDDDDTKG